MKAKNTKQSKIDKAFLESDKHTLADLKLQPWTPERMLHAQAIGMLYPNIGPEGWAQYRRTSVYPGAPKDVSIFVYLSTLKPDDVDTATYESAKEFGIKRGFHNTDSVEFWDAYKKFVEIQNEIQESATKPKGAPSTSSNSEETEFPND